MLFSAIPGFFLSSFFLMLLWRVIAPDLGWPNIDIDYPMAMLITFTIWIAASPLVAVAASRQIKTWRWTSRG